MRRFMFRFTRSTSLLLLLALLTTALPAATPASAVTPVLPEPDAAKMVAEPALTRPQTATPPPASQPPAQPVTVDPSAPVTPLYLVPPGETGVASDGIPATMLPELDLRPLIAAWQAAGSPTNTPIFDQANLARIEAQAPAPALPANSPGLLTVGPHEANATMLSQRAPASPTAAQPAPTFGQLVPAPAEAQLEPSQSGPPQNCAQLLQDPGNSQPTVSPPIWPVYDQVVYYTDEAFTSPPYAWLMIENDAGDTVFSNRGPDLDSFGQPFNLPTDTLSLVTQFRYRYLPGSTGNGDRLFAELFLVGANDYQLGEFITGASLDVSTRDDGQWRTATWTLDDAAILEEVRGERVILVLSTHNNNNGVNAVVYLDEITATACGAVIVGGNLRRLGNGNTSSGNLSNALLLLIAGDEEGEFVPLAITTPRSDGLYAFGGLPAIPEGLYYRVIYVNFNPSGGPLDDTRLSLSYGSYQWGPIGASELVVLANFDISNLILDKPDPYATVVAPAGQNGAFTWRSRGLAGDKYQYCLYDPQTVYPNTNDPIILCTDPLNGTQANIGPGSFPANYPFRYGQRYAWYVVGGPVNSNDQFVQYGYSFYEHPVIFVETASQPPNQPRSPGGSLPAKDTRRAWTIMIYFAGDNDLGDPNRLPNPISNLQGQFEALKRAAPRFSNAHVVAFGDFFGNTGSSICYLSDPSGPQCRELGEQNSADPAVLTNVINQGLAFPAERRMLVISSHGHAVLGANLDETTPGQPTMAPNQLVQALADARLNEAGRKLDVLFFNACLMANFELAAMMAPYANYMVASADQLWVLTFYERILARLGSNSRDMAAGITDDYDAALQAVIPDVYRTLVALDLSRVGAVNTALNTLADTLRNNQAALLTELKTVRENVQVYDSSGNNLLDQVLDSNGRLTNREEDAFVDLAHLANLLSQSNQMSNATVRQAATNLTTALNDMIVRSIIRSGSNDEGARHDYVAAARGLAIYFPNGTNFGDQPTYSDLYLNRSSMQPFTNTSQWDDFVRGYINGVIGRAPGSVGRAPGSVGRAGRPISGQGIPFQGRVYLPLLRR